MEVAGAILRDRPQMVALELPATLARRLAPRVRAPARNVADFLPRRDYRRRSEPIYVLIEPADPFTEAIRTGSKSAREIVFADPDAGQRPHLKDAYPDTYAIRHIGLDRYMEAYRVYPQPRSRRSRAMRRESPGNCKAPILARVLVVVSLNLLDPVLDAMEEPQAQPLARAVREGMELFNPHPESSGRNRRGISAAAVALRTVPRN